ncbi:MAG: hypothetical protein NUV76_13370 [Candidatus Kuenenia sp.]|nr:hypothetical protein [Candidatus Kuenenia sp.]
MQEISCTIHYGEKALCGIPGNERCFGSHLLLSSHGLACLISSSGLKHQDLKAKEGNNRIFVTFGNITVNIPAPSQGIINDMVDEFGGVILGVLIGVPVFASGIILGLAINSGGNGDS